MLVHDFAQPHEGHCLRVAGWIDACIELFRATGRTELVTCRARGDAECRLRATWTRPG